jgi:hypothetical protein
MTARDFIGKTLEVGDFIAYPSGGSYARLVLARIVEVRWMDAPSWAREAPEKLPKLRVMRLAESTFIAGTGGRPEQIKPSKPVFITGVERVLRIEKNEACRVIREARPAR